MKRDIDRLRALQNDDGGFGFWRRGDESWPYVSIHVAHALARAKAKGFAVPDDTLERSRRYLREIDRRIPSEYGGDVRRTLQAYALYVRALMGDGDPARARALVREAGVEGLSFEALGWVLPVLVEDAASGAEVTAIRRRLANNVAETASAAHFVVSYGDGAHLLLHSDRRADAILLEALVADSPKSDLIPKLVEGLLAHRTAGRWTNTQENVFVLLALDRYFGTYEKTTPDFVARAWLGDRYAGSHAFRGRTTERSHLAIPMPYLREGTGTSDLLLAKEGPGRLYYRIGLRYAPDSLVLEPLDRGFTVERAYEGVDDPNDVRRADDGTWRVRAGARVRVRLTMVAPSRRYHVALVDPLPAGLEPLNPALAVTGIVPGTAAATSRLSALPASAVRGSPATGGGGRARGSTTRTSATTAWRRSPLSSGRASTPTATSRGPRPRARSSSRPRRPRRCTPPRPSAAARRTASSSSRDGLVTPRSCVPGDPGDEGSAVPARRLRIPLAGRIPSCSGLRLRPIQSESLGMTGPQVDSGRPDKGRDCMKLTRLLTAPIVLVFVLALAASSAPAQGATPRLKVSENRRFLVYEDGRPFFYLGDTAWELFHRLNREEADRYLQDRAQQGLHRDPGGGAGRARRARGPEPLRAPSPPRQRPRAPGREGGPGQRLLGPRRLRRREGERAGSLRRLPADVGRQVEQEVGRRARDLHRRERGRLRRVAGAALPRPRR